MAETIVIHPVGFTVLNAYLRSRSEVTAITSTRIGRIMPPSTSTPRFPAIRLTELAAVEYIPRVWVRTLFQADCWAQTDLQADQLARVVAAVLRASANFVTAGAVMGETQDLVVRSEPDSTTNPTQPRAIVTGHAWIRPN